MESILIADRRHGGKLDLELRMDGYEYTCREII